MKARPFLLRLIAASHPTDWMMLALFVAAVLLLGEGW